MRRVGEAAYPGYLRRYPGARVLLDARDRDQVFVLLRPHGRCDCALEQRPDGCLHVDDGLRLRGQRVDRGVALAYVYGRVVQISGQDHRHG